MLKIHTALARGVRFLMRIHLRKEMPWPDFDFLTCVFSCSTPHACLTQKYYVAFSFKQQYRRSLKFVITIFLGTFYADQPDLTSIGIAEMTS